MQAILLPRRHGSGLGAAIAVLVGIVVISAVAGPSSRPPRSFSRSPLSRSPSWRAWRS